MLNRTIGVTLLYLVYLLVLLSCVNGECLAEELLLTCYASFLACVMGFTLLS